MFRFPFGTTQELNLDWFLEQWEIFKQEAQTALGGIDHALDAEIQRVEDAMTDLYAARDAAVAAKNNALDYAQSANSSAIGASQSAQNSAASAVTSAQQAQSAAQSATSAQSSATNAGTSAGNALTQAQQSEAWATGEIGGVHVPPSAPQNQSNAKQYATNAQLSANAANTAKNDARSYSQDSKAWATGIRNGEPVTSEDETYQNNAKYYAESISGDAAAAAQSASEAAASAESVRQSAAQIAENTADIEDLKSSSTGVTVDGYNLIKIAENGIGAYYASGNTLTFNASYTDYHYAIMPVEPNSRYYVSNSPRWWVLTDDDNNVLSSGSGFNPYTKKYIDTGNATKFYYTIDNGSWNNEAVYGARFAIIVAKSNSGSGARDNVSKPEWLSGISQRMCDSKYAFAFNRVRLKFTKNANKKFYFKNLLALDSDYATVTIDAVNVESITKDYISVTYTTTGEKAIVGYVYDANLSLVEQQSDIKVNVADDNLSECSALVIGDSTVEQNVMTQKMLDAFTARNKTLTLLGTRGTTPNLHEGRSGWSAKQYCTQSTDNPFYNNGFDFSHYMTTQGYSTVDFVVLQIGINDLYTIGLTNSDDKIAETMGYVCSMIDSILAWNESQKIIVNLLTPVNPNYTGDYMYEKRNIFVRYNARMLLEITKYNTANVRPSDTFAILDPESDISDNVHPTAVGYEKMALEVVNQINCWQNGV